MTKLFSRFTLGVAALSLVLAFPVLAFAQTTTTGGDRVQEGLNSIKDTYPVGVQADENVSVQSAAKIVIDWALYLAAIIAVIFIIVGGFYYITSAGNDTKAALGRKTLTNALIGLALVVLSYLIVQVVYRFLVS